MKLINNATFFLKLIDQLYTEQSKRAKYGPYFNLISYLPYILKCTNTNSNYKTLPKQNRQP